MKVELCLLVVSFSCLLANLSATASFRAEGSEEITLLASGPTLASLQKQLTALTTTVTQLQAVVSTQAATIKALQTYLTSSTLTVPNLVVTGSLEVRKGINVKGGDKLGVGITLNGVGILAQGGSVFGGTAFAFYANNSVIATNNGAIKIQGGLDAPSPVNKIGLFIEGASVDITEGAVIVESGVISPNADALGGLLSYGIVVKNSVISIQQGFLDVTGGYIPANSISSKFGVVLSGDSGIYVHSGTLLPGQGSEHFALVAADGGVSSYIYLNNGTTNSNRYN